MTTLKENGSEPQFEHANDICYPPTLFNIFLERIMADALEDHEG